MQHVAKSWIFVFLLAQLGSLFADTRLGQGSPDSLELNGLFISGETYRFSLIDQATSNGFWISLGQEKSGVRAIEWNESEETLTVETAFGRKALSMKKAQIASVLSPKQLEEARREKAELNFRLEVASELAAEDQMIGFLLSQERESKRKRDRR